MFMLLEKKILNFESINLEEGIRNYGHKNVLSLENDNKIYNQIFDDINDFDIIVFLGAGNITNIANNLKFKLKILERNN